MVDEKKKRKRKTGADFLPEAPAHNVDEEYVRNAAIVKRAALEGMFTAEDLKHIIEIVTDSVFKALGLYRQLLGEQRTEGADSSTLTEKDLDNLFFRAPQQRKIVDVIRQNKNCEMSLKEIAGELGGDHSTKTVQNLLTKIFKKTKSKNLIELRQKLPPLST
jgi:hypothetical protein